MNPKVAALQEWLNAKGAFPPLKVDGVGGKKTENTFYRLFSNPNRAPCTDTQKAAFAAVLGGTLRQMLAVERVESGGSGFQSSGHPKILYERHYFFQRVKMLIPGISNPKGGGYTLDADGDGINDSWEKLTQAAMVSPTAAMESVSWGRFQIMGAHWKALGYASAADFAWGFRESEANHYKALVQFIQTNKLAAKFRALSANPADCAPFARAYNGPNYRQNRYDEKLAEAMR